MSRVHIIFPLRIIGDALLNFCRESAESWSPPRITLALDQSFSSPGTTLTFFPILGQLSFILLPLCWEFNIAIYTRSVYLFPSSVFTEEERDKLNADVANVTRNMVYLPEIHFAFYH